jgi:uncharacterized protein (DUF58 family)
MVPSPRFLSIAALGLAVAALPVLVHPSIWTAVAAMWGALGIALLFDFSALLFGRPRVAPDVPSLVGVGDRVAVPLAVALRGRSTLGATLRAEVDAPLEPGPDVTMRIAPGESEVSVALDAPRRGTGELRAVWMRLEGPLGLLRRIQRVPVSDGTVRVIPNVRRVRELAIAHFGAVPIGGGLKVERRAGDGGEFDAMVGYVNGMDPRHIDWKSSARHMDLRVRRYRMEKNQRLVVCVDTGRTMADPIDGVQRLDHAIHAAMVLSQTALRGGDLVGLHAYGAEPEAWVAPAAGIRHASKITEACSSLRAHPVETNHVLGIHALLTRLSRRSLVVVLTELSDSTTAELMVEHLAHLVRRHLVIFVALDDPVVQEPLAREPRDAQDLAAAVVAGHLRQDRQRVLRRLSRMGVDVVHGPPGPATLKLLERYVHIKRRGLIG